MSLITLTAERNSSNPRDEDAALIKNHFKDGVYLRKGTEVSLVSLTINKDSLFEITDGNNQLVWRIGNQTSANAPFVQHLVTLDNGNYRADDLAAHIQTKLNESTRIGVFKNQWSVTHDQTARDGKGSFTINYGQEATPALNTNTLSNYPEGTNAGTGSVTNNDTTLITYTGSSADGSAYNSTFTDIATLKRGIFGNGGEVIMIAKPIAVTTNADWINTFVTAAPTMTEVDRDDTDRTFTAHEAVGEFADLGWDIEQRYDNGVTPSKYWAFPTQVGTNQFFVGDGTSAPATSAADLFYNAAANTMQTAAAGGRDSVIVAGISISGFGAPSQSGAIYGNSQLGYARNHLADGYITYPNDTNAQILPNDEGGSDLQFSVQDTTDLTGVKFSLSRGVNRGQAQFPNPNWRYLNDAARNRVFKDLLPSNFTSRGQTDWASFNYGSDNIRMRIVITALVNVSVLVAHDTGGNGVFTEEQTLARSSVAADQPDYVATNLREQFYPIRAYIAVSKGTFYNTQVTDLEGKYDTADHIVPTLTTMPTHNGETDLTNETLETNPLTLAALYKFGQINDDDIGNNSPPQITAADATGAFSAGQGSVGGTLGMPDFKVYARGNVSNPVTSINDPTTTITEPTLHLELVDFNVKGANGKTGDLTKTIAVIPKEQLTTGERSGTLHYYPNFPIMIDLNMVEDKTFYDLNARLRDPDGKIATDIRTPTEITLLFKEGEEARAERMARLQAEIIASQRSNINTAEITNVGVNNPKLGAGSGIRMGF